MLGAVLTPNATAQDRPPLAAEVLSFCPLEEALVRLQNATGIDLHYDPDAIAEVHTQAVVLSSRSPEDMLDAVLRGTGFYFYRLSSGAYGIKRIPRTKIPPGSLEGYVRDRTTGTPLSGAHVLLADASTGTATSDTGHFTFALLEPGTYLLLVSHIGYAHRVDTVQVRPAQRTELDLGLIPKPVQMQPIIAEGFQGYSGPRGLGESLSRDAFARSQGLGTPDAIRGLNSLINVRVEEDLADIHIQGSAPGEHQFRLDGVPLFEPVHLRGLLGAFNPFAIERITVHKAGYGAAEGSYLAGVIAAEHILAAPDGRWLDVEVDPLSANARVNLQTDRSNAVNAQLMAAYRRSMWDVYSPSHLDSLLLRWNTPDPFLLRASLDILEQKNPVEFVSLRDELDSLPVPRVPNLAYSDIHAAGRLNLGEGRSIRASYYRGGNMLDSRRLVSALSPDSLDDAQPNPDLYDWVNETGRIRYATLFGNHTLFSTSVRSSRYQLDHRYSALENATGREFEIVDSTLDQDLFVRIDLTPADDGNRIREMAWETTLEHDRARNRLQMGTEVARTEHRFTIRDVFVRGIESASTSWRAAFYAENEFRLNDGVVVTGGLRTTYLDQRRAVYLEPRFELRFGQRTSPIGEWSARVATGLYRQYLNQYDMSSISPSALFPSIRFWMLVDSTMAPPEAIHYAGDVLLRPNDAWTIRLESYYKDQPRLLQIDYPLLWQIDTDPSQLDSIPPIVDQDGFLRAVRGYAYGSAIALERTTAQTRIAARYEYAVAEREYAFRDTLLFEPVPWSEPHRVEVAVDWTPDPRFSATVRWRRGWGRLWGFRRAYYDYLGTAPSQAPIYGTVDFRNPTGEAHRLTAFDQVDLGAAYSQRIGPGALQVRFDVINAADRRNVADRTLEQYRDDGAVLYDAKDRYILPRAVSVSVRVRW